jgi:hypothetical protein
MLVRRFLLAAILACSFLSLALAQTTTTQNLTFPVMAVASSETAQINVLNTASSSSTTSTASCTGSMSFYDASGALIGSAAAFTVTAGHIASASKAYLALGGSGARVLVRGIVTLATTTSTTSTTTTPCSLGATMEVYDTLTGLTHDMVSAAANTGSGAQPAGGTQGGTPPTGGGTPPGGTPPTGTPGGTSGN